MWEVDNGMKFTIMHNIHINWKSIMNKVNIPIIFVDLPHLLQRMVNMNLEFIAIAGIHSSNALED
jgi:hypothetical protein